MKVYIFGYVVKYNLKSSFVLFVFCNFAFVKIVDI